MAKADGSAGAADKKAAKAAKRAASKERRSQMWQAFQMQRREDKALVPILAGVLLGSVAVFALIGFLLGVPTILIPLGVVVGILLAVIVFGRRLQRSVYAKADGQPGAAGWALDNLRGSWRVNQAVAGTTQLDAVHRVLGRPGVILVAEGAPHRVKGLLAQEKKRVSRIVGDTPIYDVVVGDGEGQVPLSKLQRHLSKLPRNIDVKQMDTLEARLAALGARGGAAMPKGPLPAGAKMRNVQRTVRRR
jgi:F0F1-type ATP synthase assembly protein I